TPSTRNGRPIMSETATETTPPEGQTGANGPVQLPDDHPLVKALAAQKDQIRELKSQAQANANAATKLAEIEEASKTEAQKQAEHVAALEAKVREYETREQIAAWKAEVSEATGVPAAALAGSTREEIEAHAATLKPLIEAAQQPPG